MNRLRVLVLALVSVVALGGAFSYFAYARTSARVAVPVAEPVADLSALLDQPRIVFRDTRLGGTYGRLAVAALADPDGPRAFGDVSCERVYATARAGVCVTATRGMAPRYGVSLLDQNLRVTSASDLVGLPSRARMSRDGTLTATTTFVTGHSYSSASFSTATILHRDGKSLGNLEAFRTTLPNGQPLDAADRNFWGVTFAADDDTFYATAASGTTTWLVRGSLRKRTLTAVRTDAECPSLSPDGSRLAYKKRLGNATPGVWRLASLDLATGTETLLAETRSVDDQVEWLDGNHLLYGLPRTGSEATTSDIWSVPADGTGTPVVLIHAAASPAAVRS
jgi:hypothetical protein